MNGFLVNLRSPFVVFDKLQVHSEILGKIKPPVVFLSEAWTSNVIEIRMLHLSKYLTSYFHPVFNRIDVVVV